MFPQYQQQLFEEVCSLFPKTGEFEVTYNDTQELKYMDMVINESMRLIAPVPLVGRQPSQEITLSNGWTLSKDIQIWINIFHVHRRKDIWGPRADTFYPDHFLPSNMAKIHSYAFLPFTKGVRNCIGKTYKIYIFFICILMYIFLIL